MLKLYLYLHALYLLVFDSSRYLAQTLMFRNVFIKTSLICAQCSPDNITNLVLDGRLLGTSYYLSFYWRCLKGLKDVLLLIKRRCSLNVLLRGYDVLLLLSLRSRFHCKFEGICLGIQ